MSNNSVRKLRVFVALLLCSLILINTSCFKVLAASTLTVNQTVDSNKVTIKVNDATNTGCSVSVLVMQKVTNSVAYMDQGTLNNGEYTFITVLPKGEYTGYISSSSGDKVTLQDISIVSEESITGFRTLAPITVAKGQSVVLPNSVVAIFNDGANREVGVKWTNIPSTDTPGQYTITGTVNGTAETVNLVINVGNVTPENVAPTVTLSTNATTYIEPATAVLTAIASDSDGTITKVEFYNGTTLIATVTEAPYTYSWSNVEEGSYAITAKATDNSGAATTSNVLTVVVSHRPGSSVTVSAGSSAGASATVSGSFITTAPALTGTVAKAEVTSADLAAALNNAKADTSGNKTVTVTVPKVDGAKSYEPVLPVSALSQSSQTGLIRVEAPVATLNLPNNMLKSSEVSGATNISVSVELADKAAITNADLRAKIGDRPILEISLKVDGKVVAFNNPQAPVKISVPYKPTAEELKNPEHIVIYYIDGNGNAVKVPNAKYDSATGTVAFFTTHFSKYAVATEFKTFSDLGGFSWAQNEIEILASKGVINGTSESTFAPSENITRADFIVLLMKTLGITTSFTENFSDVSSSDYFYEALGMAKKLGITQGIGNNIYNPKEQISRQDMMVICERALRITKVISTAANVKDIEKFKDNNLIASYAKNSVSVMVSEGIVTGDGSLLNPLGNASRAEIAVIMYRIYKKI